MATYYFDGTNGSISNSGLSEGAPRKDITSGISMTSPVVLNLKRGTTVQLLADRYPTGDITIQPYGDGPEMPTVQFTGSFQLTHTGASGTYAVDGIQYTTTAPTTAAAIVAVSGARVIATNNVISGAFQNGIRPGSGASHVVEFNRISGTTGNGIYVGVIGVTAPSNGSYRYNTIDASTCSDDAIVLHDGNAGGTGNVIAFNDLTCGVENAVDVQSMYASTNIIGNVSRVSSTTPALWADFAIVGSGLIAGNRIYGGRRRCLQISGANVTVRNNLIVSGASEQGAQCVEVSSVSGALVYNNTFVGNSLAQRRMFLWTSATGARFKNNVVIQNNLSQTIHDLATTTPDAGGFDYNRYHIIQSLTNVFGGASFASWSSTYSIESASVSSSDDPQLTANYRPKSTSPLLGAGTHLGYRRDIEGKQRPNPPSIGAYDVATLKDIS
jgi:hypothetical protein